MIHIKRNVASTQAYGTRFCLHVGSVAIYFGSGVRGRGPRLEICTPFRWFRWSRSYRDKEPAKDTDKIRRLENGLCSAICIVQHCATVYETNGMDGSTLRRWCDELIAESGLNFAEVLDRSAEDECDGN